MNQRSAMTAPSDYDPREQKEYVEGRRAFLAGISRDECRYPSGQGTASGYSVKRHSWMVGHLDAEFAKDGET